MNIKLIAIDMDGTALNSHHQLDTRTLNTVKVAIAQGIIVVPATGRTFSSVPSEFLGLPIKYVITSNGADTIDLHTRSSIRREFLSTKQALEVTQRLSRHDLYIYIHCRGEHFELKGSEDPLAKYFPATGDSYQRTQIDDLQGFILDNPKEIEKIGGLCYTKETYHAILEEEEKFGNINMASTGNLNVEFNSPKASKGEAIRSLCKQLGIHSKEVMVLGDNQNDVSMFRFAGYCVAMGNAIDELKELADEITLSCDEFGAAIAIEKIL